jgi:hypothetical protein
MPRLAAAVQVATVTNAWRAARSLRATIAPAMTAYARLTALTARIEGDPAALARLRRDGDALADDPALADDDAALRWRLAVLRAVIAAPPDGDAVRELYGELVDRYRDQPARLAQLRPLGDEIHRREADGTLARSLVVRSARRSRSAGGGDPDGSADGAGGLPRGDARRGRRPRRG